MDYQFSVLLYSKYSQLCTELLNDLEVAPVNLQIVARLRPICIDNEKIRNQIYKSGNINISVLPCILLLYPSGAVEKYEGETAFQWADETIRKYLPKPPTLARGPSDGYQEPQQTDDYTEDYTNDYTEEDQDTEEENSSNNRASRKRLPPKKRSTSKKNQPPKQNPKQNTNQSNKQINKQTKTKNRQVKNDDLIDVEDILSEEDLPKRPPVAVRTGPGSYEISDEYNEMEDVAKSSSMTGRVRETNSAQSIKSSDLMAAALAMAKERETTESSQRGTGMIRGQQGPI